MNEVVDMWTAINEGTRTSLIVWITINVLAAVVVVIALAWAIQLLIRTYWKSRGLRVVTCPETMKRVAVNVDARHAAATCLFGDPALRLSSCTRWPERQDCAQRCIRQIEMSPIGCRLREMLNNWYRGKHCAYCYGTFGEIHWFDHKPALLTPEGNIVEWETITPELVALVLATDQPVCWDCKIAETFRAEHPELVVDRPEHS